MVSKSCRQIGEGVEVDLSRVGCQKQVLGNLDECSLRNVEGTETRLELFTVIISSKVGLELGSDELFLNV